MDPCLGSPNLAVMLGPIREDLSVMFQTLSVTRKLCNVTRKLSPFCLSISMSIKKSENKERL